MKKGEISVPFGAGKSFRLLLVSCVFAAGGCWMLRMPDSEIMAQPRYNSPTLVHGIGWISLIGFVLAAAVILVKLGKGLPGLTLDDRGLTDNASAFSAGFIPWSEIYGIEARSVTAKQRVLYVLLKDPEKYLATRNPLVKALLRLSQKLGPSPVAIPSVALAIGFDELVQLVSSYQSSYAESCVLPLISDT
jgi:hypothetical protein